jgi:predicted 3-demethylubiquinone-9 3-methyltransferase (glyoxalase superfamily)
MRTITPCLWFDGRALEAAEFYVAVFPDSRITEVMRTPEGHPGGAGEVLHVSFELGGRPFSGLNGGPMFTFSEAVSFQVPCADQAESDRYHATLAEGGEVSMCGWVRDRFGLSWQVYPARLLELVGDPDRDRAGRAMQAMMTMRRIDLAAIEAAADGVPAG